MQTEGSDACQRALDTVIKLPDAKQLFDESISRFRDVTCIGLCNWANVHLCHAKKLLEHAAEGGKKPADIKKDFEEHCKEALKRYNEALGYNSAPRTALCAVIVVEPPSQFFGHLLSQRSFFRSAIQVSDLINRNCSM